ncbi:MAG TPA: YegS/Rv2252/BmrU family lipid kinase [Bacteroidales bacterium]|nr:YegS/Rv2252/BmrU family lipid kinase [Bacteroidales bacterium]HSA44086.1 YegS/Rv2252/BmrU family lipid kinase [Bacteroidales bacterium]
MNEKAQATEVLFILNPVSGKGHPDEINALIRKHAGLGEDAYRIAITDHPGHAVALAAAAAAGGADLVVAVGGDGSVNQVASALVDTNTAMGIIPAGSGNGLARQLGIPLDPVQALRVIGRRKTACIDTATANGTFFVSMAGVGFDALVAEKFARAKTRGFFTYLRIILAEFRKYKPRKYELLFDGKRMRYRAFMISFANSGQFGYNTSIAPDASLSDGMLDICVVGKPALTDIPRIVYLLLSGKIQQLDYIDTFRAGEILVRRKKSTVVNIDGDPVMLDKDLIIKLKPLSLRVVIP